MQKKLGEYFSFINGYGQDIKIIPNLAFGALNINDSNDLRINNTPAPGVVNRYEPSGNNFADFLIGLNFAKKTASLGKGVSEWLGLELDYLQPFGQYSGTVRPRVNVAPNFDIVNFSYQIKSVALLPNITFTMDNINKDFGGYLNIGVGGAWNYLSAYQEVAPAGSSGAPMLQPFGNGWNGDFAYSIGVGLIQHIQENVIVNFGYRYMNTGHGRLDTSPVQQVSQGLGTRSLQSHLFNISLIV